MDLLPADLAGGSLLFVLLLFLITGWAAQRNGFFRLPLPSTTYPVTFFQTVGVFLTYLILGSLIIHLVYFFLGFLATGELKSIDSLSKTEQKWALFAHLCTVFVLIVLYTCLMPLQTKHFIFWGEGRKNVSRFWKSVGMGVAGWCVSYPSVILITLLASAASSWLWGEGRVEQVAVKQLELTIGDTPLLIAMVVAVVFLVPVVEEILFRGFLQNLIKRYINRMWAIVITAALFALLHFATSQGIGNVQLIVSLFVLSLFLGFIYERERTIWAPITLHISFNAFSVFMILLTHN